MGWAYGFPKMLPLELDPRNQNLTHEQKDEKLGQWLVDQGYPQKDLELALKHCRMWVHTTDVESDEDETPDADL